MIIWGEETEPLFSLPPLSLSVFFLLHLFFMFIWDFWGVLGERGERPLRPPLKPAVEMDIRFHKLLVGTII